MGNLADAIESFIMNELFTSKEDYILVQRNELATRMECAPSQVSYALSTRFTTARGFVVESRRGTGGFIRIMRLEGQLNASSRRLDNMDAYALVNHLQASRLITEREGIILHYTLDLLEGHADADSKKAYVQEAYKRLNATQERG